MLGDVHGAFLCTLVLCTPDLSSGCEVTSALSEQCEIYPVGIETGTWFITRDWPCSSVTTPVRVLFDCQLY